MILDDPVDFFIEKRRSLPKSYGRHKNIIHNRGPYTGTRTFKEKEQYSDIALDASLRAKALNRVHEEKGVNRIFSLNYRDLRKKIRKARGASLIIFVVDSSDSMSIKSQMAVAKGVIISLLAGVYKREDRMALVTFRDRHASVLLYPTKSISLARDRLSGLPAGGTTPFAHGLLKALELVKGEKVKNPQISPVMVILSDGEANVPYHPMEDCMKEIKAIGALCKRNEIKTIVIDTKPGGLRKPKTEMKNIAGFFGAWYMHIDEIGVKKVVNVIREIENNN